MDVTLNAVFIRLAKNVPHFFPTRYFLPGIGTGICDRNSFERKQEHNGPKLATYNNR